MTDIIIKENENIHNIVAKKYNSRHIEIYNEVEQSRIRGVIRDIIQNIENQSSIHVMDYGCGTGNLTKFFLENGCKVVSLDISDESLHLLEKLNERYKDNLSTKKFDGYEIPFEEGTFDVLATYSVLHHIPNYMEAIKDMTRVIKNGGYLYIDHEHNANHWNPSSSLLEYSKLYNSLLSKIKSIILNGEIFEYNFWKGMFIRRFINPKYANEGDIHVWKDDHIDWENIIIYLTSNGFEIIENIDYLQYHPYVSTEDYNLYSKKVNNMKYIIARKLV